MRDENMSITCSGSSQTVMLIENRQTDAGIKLQRRGSVEIEIIREEVEDSNAGMISE